MDSTKASRVLLIAGGTGSIGSRVAALAAASGWAVAIHGRRQDRVDAAIAEVLGRHDHANVSGHAADFSQADHIAALVEAVVAAHGRIDAVVDCSVSGPSGVTGRFAETTPDAYAALAENSIVAFQRLAHAALPALRASRGALVALVSDAGIHAAPNQSMIGAMRAATIGFVRNLAMEVAREGIRANVVSPSYVEETATAQRLAALGQGRLEKARSRAGLGLPTAGDVANLVFFLCSAEAAKITGQVISINGGLNA